MLRLMQGGNLIVILKKTWAIAVLILLHYWVLVLQLQLWTAEEGWLGQ